MEVTRMNDFMIDRLHALETDITECIRDSNLVTDLMAFCTEAC